jgi:hypothetical protein
VSSWALERRRLSSLVGAVLEALGNDVKLAVSQRNVPKSKVSRQHGLIDIRPMQYHPFEQRRASLKDFGFFEPQ